MTEKILLTQKGNRWVSCEEFLKNFNFSNKKFESIENIKEYEDLKIIHGLFEQVQLDESRTCIFWNEFIDLPSDTIYEYGKVKAELHE